MITMTDQTLEASSSGTLYAGGGGDSDGDSDGIVGPSHKSILRAAEEEIQNIPVVVGPHAKLQDEISTYNDY